MYRGTPRTVTFSYSVRPECFAIAKRIEGFYNYILLFSSSITFALSFIFPDLLGFLTFFYLIPIFYLGLKDLLSFKDGFLWGICFYSIHFYYLFILIHEKAQGEFRQIASIFVIIYFSFYAGLWFYLANKFSKGNIQHKIICWVLFTFLFIFFNYNFVFWIFGSNSGYVLTHPLLPLTNYKCLDLMSIIGIWFATLILIIFSWFLTYVITYKKYYLLFFLPVLFLFKKDNKVDQITYNPINSPNSYSDSPYDIALNIKTKILEVIKKNPNVKIILFPESTFPFALNEFKEVIDWWFYGFQNKKIHILIGSHRSQNGKLFNTVYHLFNCRIINYYDKTNLMFFSERIPNIWRFFSISKFFLNNSKEFFPGNTKAIFKIENLNVQPCICSDLFLQKQLSVDCDYIMFFMNISWFSCAYVKRLLHLFIRFKEIELNKKIIYVS